MNGSSNSWIVVTTINSPTDQLKNFAVLSDYNLVVVGDLKTPENWNLKNSKFLSSKETLSFEISKTLPYNSYSRKNIGYLYAIREGAELIIDTDDDNDPGPNWGFPSFVETFDTIVDDPKFINIYNYFYDGLLWPRGFPLEHLTETELYDWSVNIRKELIKVGVWQGIVNGDPDVDAIYRLIINKKINFNKNPPLVLGNGLLCPFNSQNTAFTKIVFPLLYIPSTVSFRFTDILRGWIAQPIMWKYGLKLGFLENDMTQMRNDHNFIDDFRSELPCYMDTIKVCSCIAEALASGGSNIQEDLLNVYEYLKRDKIVKPEEFDILKAWLFDLNNIYNG
jgi:hypothetical protein